MNGAARPSPGAERAAHDAPRWRRAERAAPRRLVGSIGLSAVLHVLVIAGFVLRRPAPRPPSPPVYRVDLVAAPPGAPAIGAVAPPPPAGEPAPAATPPAATPPAATPPAPTPKAVEKPAPAPPRPETRPRAMPLPTKAKAAPPVATPMPPSKTKPVTPPSKTPAKTAAASPPKPAKPATVPPAAPPTKAGDAQGKPGATGPAGPRAAGGAEGGRGADVANVHIAGLEFPYPGYLQNIVRQVRLRFTPSSRAQALQADVAFLIHRDGSVSDVRIVRRSGDYGFDLEARGAIESSGQSAAFGALPDGFRADVLPVTFSFDPSVIR